MRCAVLTTLHAVVCSKAIKTGDIYKLGHLLNDCSSACSHARDGFLICVLVLSSAIVMLVSCWCHGHLLWLDVNGCVLLIQSNDLYRSIVKQVISLVFSKSY
jgi:hypothetical protein